MERMHGQHKSSGMGGSGGVWESEWGANLDAGFAQDGALELLHGTGDLVTHGGLALLVVHLAASEEAVAAGGGCSCCVGGRHCMGWVFLLFGGSRILAGDIGCG